MRNRISVVALPVVAILAVAFSTSAVPAANQGAAPAVTFHKDVVPVLQKNCQSCHRPGQIGPFSMLTYKETRPVGEGDQAGGGDSERCRRGLRIRATATSITTGRSSSRRSTRLPHGSMQARPKGSGGCAAADRVARQAAGRSSRTSAFDLPPYPVPAQGIVEWERIAFPAPFKEDTWVTSVEILPGVPAVVHHLCFGFQKHRADDTVQRVSMDGGAARRERQHGEGRRYDDRPTQGHRPVTHGREHRGDAARRQSRRLSRRARTSSATCRAFRMRTIARWTPACSSRRAPT